MELNVINEKGELASTVSAPDEFLGREFNEALVHQLVVAFMANGRQGTRAQKARADIHRSHKKPWRQKGTGRARAGFSGSPLWRGGGRIFPNLPEENFSQKVNKKMYRAGMCTILSQLAREGRLLVVDELKLSAPKTKVFARQLQGMGLEDVMIITDHVDPNLYLSARNLPHVLVVEAGRADPVNLVRFSKILITRDALKKMEEVLK
jgi:large subunit ribosomal protein L4